MNPHFNTDELHVIFGAGPVGLVIMDEVLERGGRVRIVNRSGGKFPAGVETMQGDVTDHAFARRAAEGASVIYFALNPPYTKWPELFPALQEAVLQAAIATGAKLVVMENVYMYGDTGGAPLHEGLPYNTHTRKGQVRAHMSEALFAAHNNGQIRVMIGRASDFYGPRVKDSALGERVFEAALQGKAAQVMGNPDKLHTVTYMPDVGQALVTLGQHEEAFGRAWHIPNAPAVTTRAMLDMVYAEMDAPTQVSAMPNWMISGLSLFVPILREIREMMYEFDQDFVVESQAFTDCFGQTATPLEEGIAATVAWYQSEIA